MEIRALGLREWEVVGQVLGHRRRESPTFLLGPHPPGSTRPPPQSCVLEKTIWGPGLSGLTLTKCVCVWGGVSKGPGKGSRVGSVGGGALARGHRDPMK